MSTVENGMHVKVHYTGSLADGEVFDSSRGRDPLAVTMGQGQLISGFENALLGMSLNEHKTITIPPEEAYGFRDEDAVKSFSRSQVPDDMDDLQVGQTVALRSSQGRQIPGTIVKADDENITVDLNHPLAGETLTFELEVVQIG
jgi:peptidylprolyl isomerase